MHILVWLWAGCSTLSLNIEYSPAPCHIHCASSLRQCCNPFGSELLLFSALTSHLPGTGLDVLCCALCLCSVASPLSLQHLCVLNWTAGSALVPQVVRRGLWQGGSHCFSMLPVLGSCCLSLSISLSLSHLFSFAFQILDRFNYLFYSLSPYCRHFPKFRQRPEYQPAKKQTELFHPCCFYEHVRIHMLTVVM
jgi:hypothetical protein